ncbi:MAG TPA: hypothetical protein VGM77_13615 [Gemmatimonadales bacterium]|jgi:ABC-type multidrug transport system permease subunit
MAPFINRLAVVVALVAVIAGAFAWHAERTAVPAPAMRPAVALTQADSTVATPATLPLSASLVQLLGKTVITTVFGLVALFIVLSRRFDSETRKWAFSVLTLIAGVWLGSAA